LKKGKKIEGSVCRFFLHLPMFTGLYSKKPDYKKLKKVILADFDPFHQFAPSKHFRPFFQLSGAFLGRRDF